MKILLIDIDSKIPNLALMKLSAYHKKKGDDVELNMYLCSPDKTYVSCVFNKNRDEIKGLPFDNMVVGGPGTEKWDVVLDEEIEHIYPDYELYRCEYALGFTTRGCIRNCEFCIVPKKEGKIRPVADIGEFWNGQKEIILLDNNILAAPEHFFKVCSEIKKNNLKVDFTQGLDIRLLTEEKAKILKSLRVKEYRFAFDNIKDKKKILRGVEILNKYNIRWACFYVLAGFNSTFEDALERLNLLRESDQRPYLMIYEAVAKEKRYKQLMGWCNHRAKFARATFEEYLLWVKRHGE